MKRQRENFGLRIADCGFQHPTSDIRHPTSARPASAAGKMLGVLGVLACAVVLSADGRASASIISFDNPAGPGHFNWAPTGSGGEVRLYIFFPATDQTSHEGDGAFRQQWSNGTTNNITLNAATPNRVQTVPSPSGSFIIFPDLLYGDLIPSPAPSQFGGSGTVRRNNAVAPDSEFCFPEGVQRYVGVRFDLGAGIQYGWIGVTRTGWFLDPFAWGYETEVGVPIAAGVPEPATLSLLLLGGMSLLRRRRSRAN